MFPTGKTNVHNIVYHCSSSITADMFQLITGGEVINKYELIHLQMLYSLLLYNSNAV